MDRIIVYASYEQYEYVNYYHLINNSEFLIEYCPEEKIDDIFQEIVNIKSGTGSLEIYIVQDENATEWDYFNLFREHNIELHMLDNIDDKQLYDMLNTAFGRKFSTDNDYGCQKLCILFYGNAVLKNNDCGINNNKIDDNLRKAEKILRDGSDEEKTEFARIIEEKYERMSQ